MLRDYSFEDDYDKASVISIYRTPDGDMYSRWFGIFLVLRYDTFLDSCVPATVGEYCGVA